MRYGQVLQPVTIDVQPRWILLHVTDLQVSAVHADTPAMQLMSHAHEAAQLIVLHDSRPRHSTLHAPGPQLKLAQLARPLQVIAHDRALLQLMPLRHALAVEHAMLHDQPLGHTTGSAHAPLLSAQSIVQVLVSPLHDVHCIGHTLGGESILTAASTMPATQKPSMQVRPALQSDCLSHAKSSLRWLIEHAASARPVSSASGFMARLRS